jgi:hsp70-interacting protein
VVAALVSPVPYGPDGDNVEADADFEEKGVHLLYTYAVTCHGALSASQKGTIKTWIQSQKKTGGEAALLERWDLSRQSYAELVGKLL